MNNYIKLAASICNWFLSVVLVWFIMCLKNVFALYARMFDRRLSGNFGFGIINYKL